MLPRSTGQFSEAQNVFRSLPISTECQRIGRRLIGGHWLWVSGMRLPSGDSLLVVSNKDSDPVMWEYSKRWEIEVLYYSLKSRGVNFEDANLKDEERLKRLFLVWAISFCWAYHVGAWLNEVNPIWIKKHQRPARSMFRYGFDQICHVLFNPTDKREKLLHALTLLWNAIIGPKGYIDQLYPIFWFLSCTMT